jgi:lipoate-protein ligase A
MAAARGNREVALRGRVLRMGPAAGPLNMAIDEAIAERCRDSGTLRFYAWHSGAVSLGYAQRAGEIDASACRRSGVEVVRRPTGGRAVLHHLELTFSLVLPLRPEWAPPSTMENHRRIHRCLAHGLDALGVSGPIEQTAGRTDGVGSVFCVAAAGPCELLVGGKKLVGVAQRRFRSALLQQGTILCDFDVHAYLEVLPGGDHERHRERFSQVGSLREALGGVPDRRVVEAAVAEAIGCIIGIGWIEGELDPEEASAARRLVECRYATEEWTLRR